jgi:hypothetical protein
MWFSEYFSWLYQGNTEKEIDKTHVIIANQSELNNAISGLKKPDINQEKLTPLITELQKEIEARRRRREKSGQDNMSLDKWSVGYLSSV